MLESMLDIVWIETFVPLWGYTVNKRTYLIFFADQIYLYHSIMIWLPWLPSQPRNYLPLSLLLS